MEALSQAPGIFIGLMGWAATTLIVMDTVSLSFWQRRFLIIFSWMLWMIPAFDAVVYQGMLTSNAAITYGATMTGALIFVVSLTAFLQHTKR
ncbi:MAG: hypothetical protein HC914_03715 [Chloroflexaceae bacterium]|nr:hypothetical protein [Chloroflexaceae bacterium]